MVNGKKLNMPKRGNVHLRILIFSKWHIDADSELQVRRRICDFCQITFHHIKYSVNSYKNGPADAVQMRKQSISIKYNLVKKKGYYF